MFIRLFIKTIDKDKVEIVIKYLMSYINEDNIKYKDILKKWGLRMNNNEVYYIILEDDILLSKKKYNHWKEIQNEYYYNFKTCIGPLTYEDLVTYLGDDFGDENTWLFIKQNLKHYFESSEIIHNSDRKL